MAGSPPPPDAPPPAEQAGAAAAAVMAAAPIGLLLCLFQIPGLPPFPSFKLPFPITFDFPPTFSLALPPLCDLAKAIADEFPSGGGRVGQDDLENDPEG